MKDLGSLSSSRSCDFIRLIVMIKDKMNCDSRCLICDKNVWTLVGKHQEFKESDVLICSHCGFITTHPLPSPRQLSEYYHLVYRHAEKSIPFLYRISQEQRAKSQFDFILPYLPKRLNGLQVLEVGSGLGALLANFSKNGADVVGFEPRSELVDYARNHSNVKLHNSTFKYDLVAGKKFDLIILSHVIEHFDAPNEFVLELGTLLSEKGIFFIEVPNDNFEKIYNRIHFRGNTDSHLHFFNTASLLSLMSFCGYKKKAMLTVGTDSETVKTRSSSNELKLSFLNQMLKTVNENYENKSGVIRYVALGVRKIIAVFLYLLKILALYFKNPNFKYYKNGTGKEGNWIRSVFSLP